MGISEDQSMMMRNIATSMNNPNSPLSYEVLTIVGKFVIASPYIFGAQHVGRADTYF